MPLHIYMELKAKSPETSNPEVDKIPSSNPPSSACGCGCAKPHVNTLKIRLKSKPNLNLFIITSFKKRTGAWPVLLKNGLDACVFWKQKSALFYQ
jgi:hypothetical protein